MKSTAKNAIVVVALVLTTPSTLAQQTYPYQSPEVWAAWAQGYKGQGTQINVIDNFSISAGCDLVYGQCHGSWTNTLAKTTAPSATVNLYQQSSLVVGITPNVLNIFNLSYALYSPIANSAQNSAIVGYAQTGKAVVVKSAGNDYGLAVGDATKTAGFSGKVDVLATSLAGQPSAILTGSLSKNGTPSSPASMANYSQVAGASPVVQRNFLVVGVDESAGLPRGTSFAAPIVSGYAAILGSKFPAANAIAVTNQLLNTARTDTVTGYNPATYGRGEASITRALAPSSIK
jgi:subtilisin family serine protease